VPAARRSARSHELALTLLCPPPQNRKFACHPERVFCAKDLNHRVLPHTPNLSIPSSCFSPLCAPAPLPPPLLAFHHLHRPVLLPPLTPFRTSRIDPLVKANPRSSRVRDLLSPIVPPCRSCARSIVASLLPCLFFPKHFPYFPIGNLMPNLRTSCNLRFSLTALPLPASKCVSLPSAHAGVPKRTFPFR
jgi:hypothetical protein